MFRWDILDIQIFTRDAKVIKEGVQRVAGQACTSVACPAVGLTGLNTVSTVENISSRTLTANYNLISTASD